MGAFKFPVNPVLVYNSSAAQSYSDAEWYIAQRLLPSNYLAFNFGTGSGVWGGTSSDPYYDGSTGSVSCQAAVYNGINVFSSGGYSGLSVKAAWLTYAAAYGIDCVLLSTFTPFTYFGTGPGYGSTLSGIMGNSLPSMIANGRLGCPATVATYTFSWASEQIPRNGTSLLQSAVNGAIASELVNNAALNHWCSSSSAYGDYVTASNNATILAWLGTQGLSTVDLGGTEGDINVNYADWFSGTVSPAPSLFALCMGDVNFNLDAPPGSLGYSNNYAASQGAWGFTWDSYDWNFAFDLLYNGGSAAVCTATEPTSAGLRDPFLIYQALIANHSCIASLLPWITYSSVGTDSAPSSYPNYTNPVAYPQNVTAVGDPLYRPYRNTFTPASGAYFGLVGKLPFGLS